MITRILPLLALLMAAAPAEAQTPLADRVQALTAQAREAPEFRHQLVGLDIYRVLEAAGVSLSNLEALGHGELAANHGLNIEAETALKPLIASGVIGRPTDPQATRNKRLFEVVSARAKDDRNGGLKAAETEAIIKDTGLAYVALGEANLAPGNFITAMDWIRRGLARGGMTRGEIALAKLHLGIALYRARRAEEALTTWSEVDAGNGAPEIARAWLAIATAN